MLIWPRTKKIRQVVIHVNVGPEVPITSGEDLVRYLASIEGGYHQVHDDDSTLRCANDSQCVRGAKGGDCNEVALHHCIIGRADQTAEQWADRFSRAAIARCAQAVATDCVKHGLNTFHIAGAAIRSKDRTGICGHGDVTNAWSVVGGHWDPGPHFPWHDFITQVNAHIHLPVQASAWRSEWEADVPKPNDVTDVLVTEYGTFKLKADGSIESPDPKIPVQSYFSIPAGGRLGERYFVAITRRRDGAAQGYTIWGNDSTAYDFGPDIDY